LCQGVLAVASLGGSLAEGVAAKGATGAIGASGRAGEAALAELGGESQVFFRTSRGARYVDQLVNGVAHESKVGAASLTKFARTQIAKDAELLSTGQVKKVVWHFFKSAATGKGGPSGPLRDELIKNGIEVIVH
jgi:hypothetical protein